MPTTPTYGFPYPSLTDPPNGPAQLESLADAVETALDQQRADILSALSIAPARASLPDDDPQTTANAWEDWGMTTIANPDRPVHVFGIASGHAFNDATSGNYYASIRVGISLDGGVSWDWGNGPREQSGSSSTWAAGTSIHLVSGTPSSTVLIKAQHQSSSTNSRYFNGAVIGLALHQ